MIKTQKRVFIGPADTKSRKPNAKVVVTLFTVLSVFISETSLSIRTTNAQNVNSMPPEILCKMNPNSVVCLQLSKPLVSPPSPSPSITTKQVQPPTQVTKPSLIPPPLIQLPEGK